MPLTPGSTRAIVSRNISEMVHSGYPQRVAVAASLSNARRHPGIAHRDMGGPTDYSGGIGGIAPTESSMNPITQGLIQRYQSMPVEKLQELSAVMGGSPQGQVIQRVLQQKRMMPNAQASQPSQPAAAQPNLAPAQPQARGGVTRQGGGPMTGVPLSMADPWWTRSAASSETRSGYLGGSTLGRADSILTSAPSGSHVIPADVVAGLGDGNSLAGARIMDEIIRSGPYGTPLPRGTRGRGPPNVPVRPPRPFTESKGGTVDGKAEAVPVALSDGEYVVRPEDVRRWGHGSQKRGHDTLNAFIKLRRALHIKRLKALRGPVKS